MSVSNVSLEGVFQRFLLFNGERRNGLRNVSDVSRSRGFSIRRLRCVHFSRLMRAHLHSLLPIKCEDELAWILFYHRTHVFLENASGYKIALMQLAAVT